ncbi:MAG: hypothetical protein A2W25_07290 [candidate division Zixibacteria bacterium RBG_16_53_22]|nr:MAG: hypothetical protein A2W25_07290 [candidate division Zixibacteria bacterium RBG_16_53_22]
MQALPWQRALISYSGNDYLNMTVKTLKLTLLLLALMAVTYAWPLRVISGTKVAYVIMGGLLVVLAVATAQKKGTVWLYTYIVAMGGASLLHLGLFGPSDYFWLSMASYLAIPLICGRNVLTPEQFDRLMLVLSVVAFPNLVGLVAQLYGHHSAFLVDEFTMTASEVHVRYTSFVGGALALGMISTITALSSAYWLLARQQYRVYNALIFIASIICVYFSYSRRGYVILALGLLVILWRTYYSPLGIRKMLLAAFLLVGATFLVAILLDDVGNIFPRVLSIYDFQNDPGNVLRVVKWLEALNTIAEHPLLGVGFGVSGTLGRDPSEFLDADDIFSAESYYLQVAMEGGVLVGAIVLFVMGKVVFGSLKCVRHDHQTLLTTSILVSLAFESIAGTAITSPLMAILFWLAYGINSSVLAKNVRYAQERVQYDRASPQSSGNNRPSI